jgi:GntR family transcriptional regulator, rspAB operon transcriptional repressor
MLNAKLVQSLDRSRPLRDQIYELVRQLVITGRIPPGATVDEKEIASALKVSRTPVREAVKKLSDEHLVDVVAQSGTRASRILRSEVEQAFLIRRALEMESAAQAATRIRATDIASLEALLASHASSLARKRFAEAIARDDMFHRRIAEISHLDRLWRAIDISKAQLDRCRHLMAPRAGQGATALAQHQAIITALASGNAARARQAMADHLESSFASTLAVMDAGELEQFRR